MTMIRLILRITMTMIHMILVDMKDQAFGLLAHNHGVLEISVGSVHVPGSKDISVILSTITSHTYCPELPIDPPLLLF